MRRQGGLSAIYPQREERSVRLLEMEGDRESVCRDICRADQIETQETGDTELGIAPELPDEVDITRIVGLPIRPHQVWFQMERPGGSVDADVSVLQRGDLGRRARMNEALGIT